MAIGDKVEIPTKLQEFMKGTKQSIPMEKDFESFKGYLMRGSFICYFFLGTGKAFPYGNGYFFSVVGFCCPIPFNYLHEMLLV